MSDYSEPVRLLVFVLIPLLISFMLGFVFHQQELWIASVVVIVIVVAVIALLAKWGGRIGPTY